MKTRSRINKSKLINAEMNKQHLLIVMRQLFRDENI